MNMTPRISLGFNLNAFSYQTAKQQQKNTFFTSFHSKTYGTKFDLAIIWVIIYINYKVQTSQMLHNKFKVISSVVLEKTL